MIKRILVGLGCEPYASVAIEQAVALGKAHQAEVTGMSVIDVERLAHVGPVPLGAMESAEHLSQHRVVETKRLIEKLQSEFESRCNAEGVKYRSLCQEGDPFGLMISQARYHDLMIYEPKGLFEHGIVDEPIDELMRLIGEGVRPILSVSDTFRPIRRALIAYSGSMESAKTMKRFVELRLWPDLALRIVTFGHAEQEAKAMLRDAADYCRAHGFDAETERVDGSPMGELLPYAARWNADIIVVGNSAKSLVRKRLFGETALHVMRHADRPLFLCQ